MDKIDIVNEEEMDTTNAPKDGEASLDDLMAASVPDTTTGEESPNAPLADSGEAGQTPEEAEIETPTDEVVAEVEETAEAADSEEVAASDDTETTDAPAEADETASEMISDEQAETKMAKDAEKGTSTPLPAPKGYRGKWYIVHTYSGHENKVAKTLMQRVQAMGFEERIFDALVPTRDTIRVRGGKKETIKEKIFPGYILVNMDLSDEAWVLVRTTPGVTSFVGAQNKPTPIRDDEVQAIVAFVGQKEPTYKAQFTTGEAVKITDGPFSDFLGTVESIDEGKGKVKVLVSIFGRETPVELDFLQVSKI